MTDYEKEIIKSIKEMGVFRTPFKPLEVSAVVAVAIKALEQRMSQTSTPGRWGSSMTNEQHIENLKKLKSFHNGAYGESIQEAIKAMRKDIPKMAVKDFRHPRDGMGYTYHDWICPACGAFIAYEPEGEGKTLAGRCRRCGQLIGGTDDNS